MAKILKLSVDQGNIISGIARERGCSDEDVVNDAIKLMAVFNEIESCGMKLFYGNKREDDFFDIIGVIDR